MADGSRKKRSTHFSRKRDEWAEQNSMVSDKIEFVTEILEIAIAVIVLIGFVVSLIPLLEDLPGLVKGTSDLTFQMYLEHAFTLVIGIEFVRMLIKHTPGSALGVLVFAIARHMVLDGANGIELFMSVAALGGIFAIRKFLYVHSFEEDDAISFPDDASLREAKTASAEKHSEND